MKQPHRPPHQRHPRKHPDGSCKGSPLVITRTVVIKEPFDAKTTTFLTKIYGKDWRNNLSRSQSYTAPATPKAAP